MSWGGGGSGAAAITAHKHTNASGEGGSLDSTSLMNDTTLIDLFVNTQNSAKNLAIGDYKRSSVISGDWSFFKVSIPEKGFLNIQV